MRPLTVCVLCLVTWSVSCQSNARQRTVQDASTEPPAASTTRLPVPPPMPKRAIAPPATAPAGEQVQLADGETTCTLFIPPRWEAPEGGGEVSVIAHFHGAIWFAIDEHLRHGLDEPLICFALGEGSSVYGKPFKDRERFGRIIRITEEELSKRAGSAVRVRRIDVSSFSAGYGAVREIVQVPEYVKLIRRIVLADSLYAGWDPATTQPGATSRPAAENIEPWRAFVEAAARAQDGKTFVLTHSQVPTSYANTEACAKALIDLVGATIEPIEPGALQATLDPHFPLLYRADKGNFHVWGYGGTDGPAHMTHPRHIADVWNALDEAEARGATTRPGTDVRRGMSMRDPPEVRQRKYFEQLARKIEPDMKGDWRRIDTYLAFFEREVVRDRRLFAFDVRADQKGTLYLTGQVEYAEHLKTLVALFETLDFPFPIKVNIQLMPTQQLGDRQFAIVRAKRSFIYNTAAQPREVVNEVIGGEALYLLHTTRDGGMLLCHAPDGYVGWINADDVERLSSDDFSAVTKSETTSENPRVEAVIASAEAKLGLPYVWGGRSDEGVDCSGLVQTAFASQGIHLPRDAEQQAIVGKLVATRWHRDALRRGDVLFFMGRRGTVSHTAIYLGDDEFIEASGKVQVTSFNPQHPNYAKGRAEGFCFAKRVIE